MFSARFPIPIRTTASCFVVIVSCVIGFSASAVTAQDKTDEEDLGRGKYNLILAIGEKGPEWKNLPGTDGKEHAFEDLKDAKAIVVAFTCNSCPYAVDYEDRLIALTEEFKDKDVAVVAINVNKIAADRMDAMKERAEEKGFNFPYLFDETQQIAKDYGATYTPEFFVLDHQRKVAYMGALDDSTKPADVEKRYVADALNAILDSKEPEVKETVAVGCRIRIERLRRTRDRSDRE